MWTYKTPFGDYEIRATGEAYLVTFPPVPLWIYRPSLGDAFRAARRDFRERLLSASVALSDTGEPHET